KNQILLPEDLAAFLPSAMYGDYQIHTDHRFLPVLLHESFLLADVRKKAKIGFLSYSFLFVG
ncbi:MAG: hypothetical protein MJY90_05045, partial [Bacteroidaceae bacterium]|nr:hypothetical protein [Bacteroidaceae bacterium]